MVEHVSTFPPDLLYVLDEALDNGDLTGGAHAALRAYGDTQTIDNILGATGFGTGWKAQSRRCQKLEGYARTLIDPLPSEQKAAFHSLSFTTYCLSLMRHADWAARWSFEDMVWGGCGIPFRRPPNLTRRGEVFPRLMRRAHSRKWINRNADDFCRDEVFSLHAETWKISGASPSLTQGAAETVAAELERISSERASRIERYSVEMDIPLKFKRAVHKERKKRRRASVRALNLAVSLMGAEKVSAVLGSEGVCLPVAPDLGLRFRLARGALASGHASLDVSLVNDAGKRLAGLCVYYDMPAFDQAAALWLECQTGGFPDVLKTGNLYDLSAEAVNHPVIAESLEGRVEVGPAGARRTRLQDHQKQKVMVEEYVRQTRRQWVDRVFMRAFGPASGLDYNVKIARSLA